MSAEPERVQLRSGYTVVNARESGLASGSIAEFLRTVPGVEVDAEGRVTMRGSSSVLLLVNGRRTPLPADALVVYLKQMPASALERVEAGTIASASQDADGSGGVVNLVMRDAAERRAGSSSISASVATRDHYMGSASASGRLREVFDWDLMYSASAMRPRTDTRLSRWAVIPGDLPLSTEVDRREQEAHRLQSVGAGGVLRPWRGVSLGVRGAYSRMEGTSRARTAFEYRDDAGNTGSALTGSYVEHLMPSRELTATVGVERGRVRFTSEARTAMMDAEFRGDYHDLGGGFRFLRAGMEMRERERGVRNDLRVRLPGFFEISVGHERRMRNADAVHDAEHFSSSEVIGFRHELAVDAGYVTASRTAGRLRGEIGMRVEGDRSFVSLDSVGVREIRRRGVRGLPSLNVEWTDYSRSLVYRVGYGRRVTRPTARMLNPVGMGDEELGEVLGDLSLPSEVSDQIALGLERRGLATTIQLTPYVRWTWDPIRRMKASTSRGGTTSRLMSLDRERAVGIDGGLRASPLEWVDVTLVGGVIRTERAAAASVRNGVFATARLTLDLRLTSSTTAQLYAARQSAQDVEQGMLRPEFSSDLAITRSVAGGGGRVTLMLAEPWRGDPGFRLADGSFREGGRRWSARPSVSLLATWALGEAPREGNATLGMSSFPRP